MRLIIPAIGTRGDVQPLVLLGGGLRRAGHEVRIATHGRFRSSVLEEGLDFEPLPGDPESMFDSPAWSGLRVSRWNPLPHVRAIHEGLGMLVGQVQPDELLHAWGDAEGVVFGPTTTFAHFVAEQLGIPSVLAANAPAVATAAFPHPVVAPRLRLGGAASYLSWVVGERLQKQTFREPLRPRERRRLGLPALPFRGSATSGGWPPFPVVHNFSAAVVPRPRDWPPHVHVTGWWLPAASEQPLPDDVQQFLRAGPPPVYAGFGSMRVLDPDAVAATLLAALERSGDRAIVSGLDAAALRARPERVLLVGDLEHRALFPRLKGVVHHGGSGTVASGLAAGRPTVVVPFVFDQFFWGRRVAAVGAGPALIPFERLTAERLAAALTRLDAAETRAAAAAVGKRIRAEDGVGEAVRAVEGALG